MADKIGIVRSHDSAPIILLPAAPRDTRRRIAIKSYSPGRFLAGTPGLSTCRGLSTTMSDGVMVPGSPLRSAVFSEGESSSAANLCRSIRQETTTAVTTVSQIKSRIVKRMGRTPFPCQWLLSVGCGRHSHAVNRTPLAVPDFQALTIFHSATAAEGHAAPSTSRGWIGRYGERECDP